MSLRARLGWCSANPQTPKQLNADVRVLRAMRDKKFLEWGLTPREAEITALVVQGFLMKDMAANLGLTSAYVKWCMG